MYNCNVCGAFVHVEMNIWCVHELDLYNWRSLDFYFFMVHTALIAALYSNCTDIFTEIIHI